MESQNILNEELPPFEIVFQIIFQAKGLENSNKRGGGRAILRQTLVEGPLLRAPGLIGT